MATTTRTDEIMKGTTSTNSINLGITTKCTMRCPNCSIDVPGRATDGSASHMDVDLIYADLKKLVAEVPLRRVHLTGGEPTMHPKFAEIVDYLSAMKTLLKEIRYLTIETNGSGVQKYEFMFTDPRLFDRVFITHYVKDKIYPDNYDNTKVLEWAKAEIGDRLIVEPPVEHLRKHGSLGLLTLNPKGQPCTKYYDPGLPCGWYDGLLYRCCVSVGIDRKLGRPVTEDWRKWITELDMGCRDCCYGGT